jgi:uncharacterized protein DUF3892
LTYAVRFDHLMAARESARVRTLKRRCSVADVQVRCVSKQLRQDPHHGITHLGGETWRWTRQQVVTSIEAKTNTFYTLVGGTRTNVAVVDGPNGKYVRTHADGKWTDNLLALPECVTA